MLLLLPLILLIAHLADSHLDPAPHGGRASSHHRHRTTSLMAGRQRLSTHNRTESRSASSKAGPQRLTTRIERLAAYASDAAYWDSDELRLPGSPLPKANEDRCRALALASVQHILFVGDSRSRQLAEVFGGFFTPHPQERGAHVFTYAGHVCGNHTYRYTHEAECSRATPPSELHCDGTIRVSYMACWKYTMPCFDNLLAGLLRPPDLLVLNTGLHDNIYWTPTAYMGSRLEAAVAATVRQDHSLTTQPSP